jgi:hypothetical protein
MSTAAYDGFSASIRDADQLFDFYEKERLANHPHVPEGIEVLKRAALILAVTAWETFLEDLLKEKFLPKLMAATTPADVAGVFNSVAAKWLTGDKAKLHSTMMNWTGEGWKKYVESYFAERVASLNTPNSYNCTKLLGLFLDVDLTAHWKWRGYNYLTASKRLDGLIATRGRVTHVARKANTSIPTKHLLSRQDVQSYLLFVKELTAATDKIFDAIIVA